jgi:hypothetical protein
MAIDQKTTQERVSNIENDSENRMSQFHAWLGIASAGGIVSLSSFAGGSPDPDYTFAQLVPSYICFLFGIIAAAAVVYSLSLSRSKFAEHIACSSNREIANEAIQSIPVIMSYPRSMTEGANGSRDELISKSQRFHDLAERSWSAHRRWSIVSSMSVAISALAFVLGFLWPIYVVVFTEKGLIP